MGVAGVVTTPLVWLLGSPGAGEMVGASAQAAIGVAALLVPVLRRPEPQRGVVEAVETGKAEASGGGSANTGVRLGDTAGTASSARAERTGDASAEGEGNANSGVSEA
ncbi:hypothetical protein [Streptomyces chrestomyceticus]|uniref:hypothetical protein n=1 Tax=Streptomyces chrestomyceticus TaxID=68185 RepID=UPI0033EB7D93